jgi:hypothetical protein
LSGGSGIASIEEGDDIVVDATDPANPIVGVVPNTFLRLSGTESGFPVTGDVLFSNNKGIGNIDDDGLSLLLLRTPRFEYSSTRPNNEGLAYAEGFTPEYALKTLIDLSVLKSRLWNAATDPTVDDDADEGFVSGRSLWLNTSTGVLWKCEDATAGAADWAVYYDSRKFTKLVSVVDSAAVTGTTGNSPLRWVTIPAGTFEAGDIMSVTSRIRKTGAAGTAVSRFYQNTSQSLTGANILGLYTLAPASILYQQFNRDLVIKSSTATEVVTTSSCLAIDETMATGAATQYNIDWSVTQHIGFYVQLTNASDSVVQSYYSIEKITNIS